MELKKYQKRAIEKLEEYLQELRKLGPKRAFLFATEQPYKSDAFGEVPFVCIKIPTGGGKTLVGCEAVGKITSTALQDKLDRGIVLWFTPSEAIKTQTLKKLKDRKDSHRRMLDEAFENNVKVFSNEEALAIRKEDVDDNLCIIVASLDAFRKEKSKQSKYKVYQENGALLDHFQNIEESDVLEKDDEKTVINSLANVVRMSNPLVVVDEGHRTTSKLSIDFLKDLNPSFIIEYTATPRSNSNILVDVSASELKAEHMVKIPLVLESAVRWQNAIENGIEKRKELEKIAKKLKSEYIRPIVLLQAQADTGEASVTIDTIKSFLLERGIPEEEIAIKRSGKNELEGKDLMSRSCKIRYIITVNALAEGWDCSFAYVLVSVANLGAKIAVEQVIGRVIRMPQARRKAQEELNRSYIFASARNFNEAANEVISGLEDNGFSREDVVKAGSKTDKDPLEVGKAYKATLKVPLMAIDGERLTFEGLVEDLKLANQDPSCEFVVHFDSDGRAVIDIKEDEWTRSATQTLNLVYKDKNYSRKELAEWLDKKLRFAVLERTDKMAFVEKVLDFVLKKHTLSELSINRYVLVEKLAELINLRLEEHAQKKFEAALKKKNIGVVAGPAFPDTIFLKQPARRDFNKNLYERIDPLNGEETEFIDRLDLDKLPNIEYWVRNREKIDPFYIQGWKKGKFYPDFVAVTKKGNISALEWKGEDRITNADTAYKVEIGNLWASLGKGKLHFFLVNNGNIEETLTKLKEL
jgi:superfamily II DNA or RNA helicase